MLRKRKPIVILVILVLFGAVWLVGNPPARFGWCCYGYTAYNACPRLISDFQVRADGTTRKIAKTHRLTFEQVEWLLDSSPEVLIIALGWDGVTTPDHRIRDYRGCETHLLKNREAIALFNRLKEAGKRVAIHYHSTC
jgi:hypothetical protein